MHSATHSGSPRTVFASFLHFDLSFTIWVLLGSLGVFIAKDLGLNPAQQGLMVAIPTLSGSITRFPIGLLGDRFGGKRVGICMLLFLSLPLLMGWLLPIQFPVLICIGLLLGVAGASFAIALPLASRWYPPERQGLVMGIAAAGNIGTVTANLFAPTLAKLYGWHTVIGLALIPLSLVLLVFTLLAKEPPTRRTTIGLGAYLKALGSADIWWFCFFYSITFGGFVGLGTFLPLYLHNQYSLNPVDAGLLTAVASFMGSTLRPLGGYLSDKFGGVRILSQLLLSIGVLYGLTSLLLPLNITAWVVIGLVAVLGLGNGAVFQLVPLRFPVEIGLATGFVGAFGGLGGFFLPTLLGSAKQFSGAYTIGLLIMAVLALVALVALRVLVAVRKGWRFYWSEPAQSTVV